MSDTQTERDMISARLARLERSNRRLKCALGVGAAAVAALGLAGFATQGNAQQRELRTQRLIIVGQDGQPRLMMAGDGDGSSLFLYGPDKYREMGGGGAGGGQGVGGFVVLSPRLRFGVDAERSKIEFLDPGGEKPRLVLDLDAEGPEIQMFDESGNAVADEE